MKKIFLTLFAVALTASVFIACDKDDDKDSTKNNNTEQPTTPRTATQVSCNYTVNISRDMLNYSNVTVSYYDGEAQGPKQVVMTDTVWTFSTGMVNIPADLGFSLSGALKENFNIATVDTFYAEYRAAYSYTLYDKDGKSMGTKGNNRHGNAGFGRNCTGRKYIDNVADYFENVFHPELPIHVTATSDEE